MCWRARTRPENSRVKINAFRFIMYEMISNTLSLFVIFRTALSSEFDPHLRVFLSVLTGKNLLYCYKVYACSDLYLNDDDDDDTLRSCR